MGNPRLTGDLHPRHNELHLRLSELTRDPRLCDRSRGTCRFKDPRWGPTSGPKWGSPSEDFSPTISRRLVEGMLVVYTREWHMSPVVTDHDNYELRCPT